jgi:glutaredoxin 3
MSSPVRVYVTSYCPFCTSAKRFLDRGGVAYETVDVSQDAEKRIWLAQTTGMRTVPQIFVGDVPLGGYTDMIARHERGELVPLLEEHGIHHGL